MLTFWDAMYRGQLAKERADRLKKLAGHFEGKSRGCGHTEDDARAFKNRVKKRRAKKGYK